MHVGDYTLEDTLTIPFTTRAFSTGIPTVLVSGEVQIYEDDSATQITAAETTTVSLDSVVGFNLVSIAATAANGFENGKSYTAILSAGTVDSVSVIGEVVGHFTIGRSAAAVDLANATDGLGALKAVVDAIPTTPMRGTDGANTTVPDAAGTAATLIGTAGASLTDLGGMSTGMKAEVNAQVVDTLQTDTPVAGVTIVEALRRVGAVVSYKLSGAGTGTETVTDWADSASTIVITVDSSGNKSAITFN